MVDNTVISEDIVKASHSFMQPEITQRRRIYLDADLIYDFRLTALMTFTRGKDGYKYVMDNLQKYIETPTLECAKFFPDLNLTDQQLDERIVDPKYADVMAAAAIPTRFLVEMKDIISGINTENESKETRDPLIITVNQRREIHPFLKTTIAETLLGIDPNLTINFTVYPTWRDVPEQLLLEQDIVCVYDVRDFLTENTTSQKLLSDFKSLSNCMVLGLTVSDETADEDEKNKGLLNLTDILDMMCLRFRFINKSILQRSDLEG